jgi:hypothetical protein
MTAGLTMPPDPRADLSFATRAIPDYVTRNSACIDGIFSIRRGVSCANHMFDIRPDVSCSGEWTHDANTSPIDEDAWLRDGMVISADGFIYDSV